MTKHGGYQGTSSGGEQVRPTSRGADFNPPAPTVGAWQPWWSSQRRAPLGPEDSYLLGAAWLHGLATADLGCGLGWMAEYIPADLYTGVDGTKTPAVDVVADLTSYTTPSNGIFMRHVLEHNEAWEKVLTNALHSFQRRMFIAIFTPEVETTHVYHVVQELGGVVEIAFSFADLEVIIAEYSDVQFSRVILPPRGPFQSESIWFFQRGSE